MQCRLLIVNMALWENALLLITFKNETPSIIFSGHCTEKEKKNPVQLCQLPEDITLNVLQHILLVASSDNRCFFYFRALDQFRLFSTWLRRGLFTLPTLSMNSLYNFRKRTEIHLYLQGSRFQGAVVKLFKMSNMRGNILQRFTVMCLSCVIKRIESYCSSGNIKLKCCCNQFVFFIACYYFIFCT